MTKFSSLKRNTSYVLISKVVKFLLIQLNNHISLKLLSEMVLLDITLFMDLMIRIIVINGKQLLDLANETPLNAF